MTSGSVWCTLNFLLQYAHQSSVAECKPKPSLSFLQAGFVTSFLPARTCASRSCLDTKAKEHTSSLSSFPAMITHTSVGSLTSLSFSCGVWHPASSFAIFSFSPSISSRDLALSLSTSSRSFSTSWRLRRARCRCPPSFSSSGGPCRAVPSLSVASSRSQSRAFRAFTFPRNLRPRRPPVHRTAKKTCARAFRSPQRPRGDQANRPGERVHNKASERLTCVEPTTKMAHGAAGEPTAKRAKVDKEDPDVLRRNELILGVPNAMAKAKELVREAEEAGEKIVREARQSLAQKLPSVCAKLEAKNRNELLKKLPEELWSKIVDESVQQNDLVALAMTCRFFRDTTKVLGKKMETNLEEPPNRLFGQEPLVTPHTFGWYRWVCDTFEILPGFKWLGYKVKGAAYEGDLLNCAAQQGSVEILRWLMEEKGWELKGDTGRRAVMGGSVEVLAYLVDMGYHFAEGVCDWAAREGRLEALKFLRGLDPPCPWREMTCWAAAWEGHLHVLKWARAQNPPCPWNSRTCSTAAKGGHLDVLMWARAQNPPCPWDEKTCSGAARGGHLDVLKWARGQDPPCPWDEETCWAAARGGHLDVLKWARAQNPPCPWNDSTCSEAARGGHLDVLKWARSQDPPCPWDWRTCTGAAGRGRLEVLKWARAQEPPCPWNESTCFYAAEGGHLEVLKFARGQDPPCPWRADTCFEAARGGHLDVLKWARAQNPPCPWNDSTCSEAARGGHLDVLKWARSQDPPCPWSREECRQTAFQLGHEHVVDGIDWID